MSTRLAHSPLDVCFCAQAFPSPVLLPISLPVVSHTTETQSWPPPRVQVQPLIVEWQQVSNTSNPPTINPIVFGSNVRVKDLPIPGNGVDMDVDDQAGLYAEDGRNLWQDFEDNNNIGIEDVPPTSINKDEEQGFDVFDMPEQLSTFVHIFETPDK